MKKILFLLGGSGNIFFQIANLENKKCDYRVSDLFLYPSVRRVLGHTNHRNIHREMFKIDRESRLTNILLPVLLFDVLFSKIFGYCFFSNIDLRFCKGKPVVYSFIYFGYFQNDASLADIRNCKEKIINYKNSDYDLNKVVVHIRGGDFLTNKCVLGREYYESAVKAVKERSQDRLEFVVVTDDVKWSTNIMEGVISKTIINKYELFDFGYLNNCKTVIASNSTFALIAILTNQSVERIIMPIDTYEKFNGNNTVTDIEILAI